MLSLLKRYYTLPSTGEKTWTYQIAGTNRWTGEPVRIGTRTRDRKVAEAKLKEVEEQHRIAATTVSRPAYNFADAVLEYDRKKGRAGGGRDGERYVRLLLQYFGRTPLSEIGDTDMSAFCEATYPGAKASTLVRQAYGPMQWVWNKAAKAGLCDPKEFSKPSIKREPVKYARDDKWLFKVLRACQRLEQRCALLFMSFSGTRATEVVTIRVADYNPQRAEIITRTKGGKERVVALPPLVNEALQLLVAGRTRDPQERLFGYASRYSLNRILKRACRRAGVEHLSPHKAGRHTFAARLLRDGASLKELQQAGGWDDIGVVARNYAHLEQAAVDKRVRGVATTIKRGDITIDYTMPNGRSRPIAIYKENQSDA
jgi:integrase